jgi:YHS domain-containing protein/thiol-disulfide isomerase/thioredoxin
MRSPSRWLWAALVCACLTPIAQAQQAVQWQANLDTARQFAAQTHRLVLVHFWASGCKPCMAMDNGVFSRPEAAQALDANYVMVKVHRDLSPEISRQFGVTAVPADVIITPQGQVLERSVGATDAQQYVSRMGRVALAWRDRSAGPLAQIAGGPPSPGAAGQKPVPGWAPPPSVAPPPQVASSSPPYAAQTAIQPSSQVPPMANQQALPPPPLGPTNAGAPVPPPSPADTSAMARNDRSPPAAGPGQPPAGPPPASMDLPPGSPPLGLDGYCPVQLDENDRWVLGNRRWGAVFEGRTYLFSGPEEQKKFLADPARYAPILSGDDVVRFVDQQERVAGCREHGAKFHGRVYLFSNEEDYQRFDKDPYRYLGKLESHVANRAMPPR